MDEKLKIIENEINKIIKTIVKLDLNKDKAGEEFIISKLTSIQYYLMWK